MKSFVPYLIFSVLLTICYYERKSACPPPQNALDVLYPAPALSTKPIENAADTHSFTMNLRMNNHFIDGLNRPAKFPNDLDLFGAVSSLHFPEMKFDRKRHQ